MIPLHWALFRFPAFDFSAVVALELDLCVLFHLIK